LAAFSSPPPRLPRIWPLSPAVPFVPPAIVLAPVILPRLLGEEWKAMVAPFQLLLIAGVGQAVINVIGESLSGRGGVAFRATVHVGFTTAIIVGLLVIVPIDGIRGAAAVHVVALMLLAGMYVFSGARRVGIEPRTLASALRGVMIGISAQAAVTAALLVGLASSGVSDASAAWLAAATGFLIVMVLLGLLQAETLRESARVLKLAWRRAGP
jgi:hypothetical protein